MRYPLPSSRTSFLVLLLTLPTFGCKSCLDLDDYDLVDAVGGYGTTTTTTTSDGGDPQDCQPDDVDGAVLVAVPVAPSGAGGGGGGAGADPSCDGDPPAEGGIDLFALDPVTGSCQARAFIVPRQGATLRTAVRVHHDRDEQVTVAGSFHGGTLELPRLCGGSSAVVLEEEAGAADSLFIVRLRAEGDAFCTEWARRAWTLDVAATDALEVTAILDDGDDVAIAGTLTNSCTLFDDGSVIEDLHGSVFFARFSAEGALQDAVAFDGAASGLDMGMGLGEHNSHWFLTGTLQHEDAGCYACTGESAVFDEAGQCPAPTGDCGSGGSGGAGGSGAGGSGGAAGGAPPDGQNALLWRDARASSCVDLDTFGIDGAATSDAQVGYDISFRQSQQPCVAFWTGLAGRGLWAFDDTTSSSALYDAGGSSMDGFLTRLDSDDPGDCAAGPGHQWNVRLTPDKPSALMWGNRVAAERCSDGAIVTAFVRDAAASQVMAYLCQSGGCAGGQAMDLADADEQLLMMRFGANGEVDWYGALGPVQAALLSGSAPAIGQPRDNLSLDPRDFVHLVVTTAGPLRTANVEPSGCAALEGGSAPGTYALGFDRSGVSERAQCVYARQLD